MASFENSLPFSTPGQFANINPPAQIARKRLVVVGDGTTGKTSLLWRMKYSEIPLTHIPTLIENYIIPMNLEAGLSFRRKNELVVRSDGDEEKVPFELAVWDTAGQEEYDSLRPLSYNGVDIILIVCSVDSPDSLFNIKNKWNKEVSHYCRNVPKVIAANKVDLTEDPRIRKKLKEEGQEVISQDQLAKVAQEIGARYSSMVSALTGKNVKSLFEKCGEISMLKADRKQRFCRIL